MDIKQLKHETVTNVTKEQYKLEVNGKEYEYNEYVDPNTGNFDTVVFDSNGQQVYDLELITELVMYVAGTI